MELDSLRRVSRGLFGNQHKLEVIAAIGDAIDDGEQDVFSRQIAKRLPDAADNQVRDVVIQLASSGLLMRVEDKTDQLRHRYRPRDSACWSACRELRDELRAAAWEADAQS